MTVCFFLNAAKLKITNISEVKISFINVMICCNDTFLQCYERYLQWGSLGIDYHFVVKAVVLSLYVVVWLLIVVVLTVGSNESKPNILQFMKLFVT